MHLMKKAVSLLLVVAMLSSFALVASAESENVILTAYRADGTQINAGDTITVGDTVKVKITSTEEFVCHSMNFYITYNAEDFQFNESGSALGEIKSVFNLTDLNGFTQKGDEEDIKNGQTAVLACYGGGIENQTIPANTDWVEFSFTALREVEGSLFNLLIHEAYWIEDVGTENNPNIAIHNVEGLTPRSLTLSVAAAPVPVPVETVTLNKNQLSLACGASDTLTATIDPDNATDKEVTWTTEPEGIVSVVDGQVIGLKEGTATVTATAGGKSATCAVTVAPEGKIPVAGISLGENAEASVAVSKTLSLTATVTPSDATDADKISWESSVPDVATVAVGTAPNQAVITAKAVGTTTVTATVGGHSASVTVHVTNPATKIQVTADKTFPIAIGATVQLHATLTPENATDTIKWSSSKPTVATVSETGVVTAVGVGSATITAKGESKKGFLAVKVIDVGDGNYIVAMPNDKTVIAGEKILLPITIKGKTEDFTSYNAYKLLLNYDQDALELLTTALDDATATLTDNNGEIEIMRWGSSKALGNMLTLEFKAKEVTDADKNPTSVTLKSAQVDISSGALDQNAPNAQIENPATVLTIEVKHFVKLPDGVTSSQGNYVDHGKDYTFTLEDPEAFYDYDVSATMGGNTVTVKKNENGSYTIENVTDEVEVILVKTPKTYQVTRTGEDVTGSASATYGTDYVFKVDKQEGFKYEISVKIAGEPYTGELAPDDEGNYKIPGTEIKGTIEIVVTKTEDTSTTTVGVYVEGTGKDDVVAPTKATKDTEFSFTVNVANGYIYTVDINVNGAKYTGASVVDSEDGTKKTYTIPAAGVTGPITIAVAKDKAFNVTFENAAPLEIKAAGDAIGKVGSDYTFTITGLKRVYKLTVSVTEEGVTKDVTFTKLENGATRYNYTYTVEKVQGDLTINLSYSVSDEMVEVVVNPFVELDGKTVYLVATRTKAGNARDMKLDTYDGYFMYATKLYVDKFNNPAAGTSYDTYLWLTTVNKGEAFTPEDALKHLTFTNGCEVADQNKKLAAPVPLSKDTGDVNHSGYKDINDAQLVWDIYNDGYQDFCITNKYANGTYLHPQVGASMTKFLDADVNKDMCVNALDAAAVIAQIK